METATQGDPREGVPSFRASVGLGRSPDLVLSGSGSFGGGQRQDLVSVCESSVLLLVENGLEGAGPRLIPETM